MGKAVKLRSYTDDEKIKAAVSYAHKGSFSEVARNMRIPRTTLIGWSKHGLWDEAVVKARQQITDKILAQNLAIATKANEVVLDRLENGDSVVTKDGVISVPMKGRDAAVVGGIMQDKAARGLGLPTQIHAQTADAQIQAFIKEFKEISESYREKQVKVVSTQ